MGHNYWSLHTQGRANHNYGACVVQQPKPLHREPVLHNKRSHWNEKLVHHNKEKPPLAATRESLYSKEDPEQPKINK